MHDKQLFEYAVIRIVPKVEREEFMNIGVVLYCSGQKYLQAMFHLDEPRLRAFSDTLNIAELESYLNAFKRICAGGKDAGPIGRMGIAERFRWLTATRSTMIQSSKVHPGHCTDAGEMLQHLHSQMVLRSTV